MQPVNLTLNNNDSKMSAAMSAAVTFASALSRAIARRRGIKKANAMTRLYIHTACFGASTNDSLPALRHFAHMRWRHVCRQQALCQPMCWRCNADVASRKRTEHGGSFTVNVRCSSSWKGPGIEKENVQSAVVTHWLFRQRWRHLSLSGVQRPSQLIMGHGHSCCRSFLTRTRSRNVNEARRCSIGTVSMKSNLHVRLCARNDEPSLTAMSQPWHSSRQAGASVHRQLALQSVSIHHFQYFSSWADSAACESLSQLTLGNLKRNEQINELIESINFLVLLLLTRVTGELELIPDCGQKTGAPHELVASQ